MSKYHQASSQIQLDDSMRSEILEHVQNPQNRAARDKKKRKGKLIMQITAGTIGLVIAASLLLPLAAGKLTSDTSFYDGGDYSSSDSYTYNESYSDYDATPEAPVEESLKTSDQSLGENLDILKEAKLVYRASVDVETKEFTESVTAIEDLTSEYGGFIESSAENVRSDERKWASFTIRIPTDQYSGFMAALKASQTVVSSSQEVENISENYYSNENQIEFLKREQQRLTEMTDQAETISDLIAIEEQLSNVEQQLQWAQEYKSSMDLDLKYSTVVLSLSEVAVYSNPVTSSWSGIGQAFEDTWYYFSDSLGNLVILLIYLLPWILLIGAVVVVIILLRRRKKKSFAKAFAQDKQETPSDQA